MPRVLAMLVLGVIALLAFGALNQNKSRHQDTFRPKRRVWPSDAGRASRDDAQTLHVVDEAELVGVRDAFSSAPIDARGSVYRCGGCLAFYQRTSVDALGEANQGRCIACGNGDLAPCSIARAH